MQEEGKNMEQRKEKCISRTPWTTKTSLSTKREKCVSYMYKFKNAFSFFNVINNNCTCRGNKSGKTCTIYIKN